MNKNAVVAEESRENVVVVTTDEKPSLFQRGIVVGPTKTSLKGCKTPLRVTLPRIHGKTRF